jgi:hypothetical protein
MVLPIAVWPQIPFIALRKPPGRNLFDSWPTAAAAGVRSPIAATSS